MLRRGLIAAAASVAILAAGGAASPALASQAQARAPVHVTLTAASYRIPRWHAYVLALSRIGDWYEWGGAGPYAFDCSGLVYWAYREARVPYFGRDTYDMLGSGRLQQVPWSQAKAGDLVFWGDYHVELWTGHGHWTLGALHSGTRVGFHEWGPWNVPSAVYHVRGTG